MYNVTSVKSRSRSLSLLNLSKAYIQRTSLSSTYHFHIIHFTGPNSRNWVPKQNIPGRSLIITLKMRTFLALNWARYFILLIGFLIDWHACVHFDPNNHSRPSPDQIRNYAVAIGTAAANLPVNWIVSQFVLVALVLSCGFVFLVYLISRHILNVLRMNVRNLLQLFGVFLDFQLHLDWTGRIW